MRFVSAGHPGPLYIPRSGASRAIESSNFPLGMIPEADFREDEITLSPGDRIYLYSDGMIEAENADGERFEIDRLLIAAESTSAMKLDESVDAIVTTVQDWQNSDNLDDDISILALEVTDSGNL